MSGFGGGPYNGGNNFASQPFAQGSRSSGYQGYNEIGANLTEQGKWSTSGSSHRGGDMDGKWARWFGVPPYTNFQRDNYADLGHESYTLPTAYIGRNLHIEKLLNVSIASQDDFYTAVLLPWQQYDGMRITWSRWMGFDHLMVQTPEEVPAPQIQTRFESGEAYQQRYGLAFKMEHGFQKTSMGQQAYAMNLAIITQAVLRTVYARCMQVLVQQRNFLSVVHAQNFATEYAKSREISKASTHVFGCLQKNTFGFDNCLASVMKLFENRQLAAPDAVVIPHGSFGVLKMCKPESRTFAICGDLAQRLDMSPTRDFISNIYNNQFQIFEHRPMSISQDSNEINMLTRHRDVGNVFRIFRDTESYSSQQQGDRMHTAIKIVDHDKQRWRTITLMDALEKSGAFDDNGQMNPDALKAICGDNETPTPTDAVFGDIKVEYLKQMIKDVERSLIGTTLPGVDKVTTSTRIASRIGTNVQGSGESLPEATINEVASAILGAAVGSSPVAEQPDVVASARDLAKATSNLGGPMRGAIVGILENSDAASQFSKSRKVMKAIGKNKDASKAVELKDKLTAAMGEDFTSGWTTISRNARENLASMQDRVQSASYAAAPIGARVADGTTLGASGDVNEWLKVKITLKNISALDRAGILTPFGAYVFRPFQSFEMGSMVVMKAGRDTGMTVVGNSDFQLGDSVTNKTHLGHFTFYFESVVHEPNHIMVVRDAMFMRYNGGAGGKFHDWSASTSTTNDDASLYSVLALHTESYEENVHDPMSLTGDFHSESVLSGLDNGKHYILADFYKKQFKDAVFGGDSTGSSLLSDTENEPFFLESSTNTVMYQGLQANRGVTNEFNQYITNTGHLGDSETVDSSLTWSGHMAFKTSAAYHRAENSVSIFNART